MTFIYIWYKNKGESIHYIQRILSPLLYNKKLAITYFNDELPSLYSEGVNPVSLLKILVKYE